jgi:hypothetical protein
LSANNYSTILPQSWLLLLLLSLLLLLLSAAAAAAATVLSTPDLVRVDVLEKCGFQPRMENTQVGGGRMSHLLCSSIAITI